MAREKRDYSLTYDHDSDSDDQCWECKYFLFPIGCMYGKNEEDYISYSESED